MEHGRWRKQRIPGMAVAEGPGWGMELRGHLQNSFEGNLDVEGEGERGLKYFDYEEIFGRAVKGDSPRNRTSGMLEMSLVKESRDKFRVLKPGGEGRGGVRV